MDVLQYYLKDKIPSNTIADIYKFKNITVNYKHFNNYNIPEVYAAYIHEWNIDDLTDELNEFENQDDEYIEEQLNKMIMKTTLLFLHRYFYMVLIMDLY